MFARIAAHEAFDAATASERVTVGEAIQRCLRRRCRCLSRSFPAGRGPRGER
jgi:hypothetical protein